MHVVSHGRRQGPRRRVKPVGVLQNQQHLESALLLRALENTYEHFARVRGPDLPHHLCCQAILRQAHGQHRTKQRRALQQEGIIFDLSELEYSWGQG